MRRKRDCRGGHGWLVIGPPGTEDGNEIRGLMNRAEYSFNSGSNVAALQVNDPSSMGWGTNYPTTEGYALLGDQV